MRLHMDLAPVICYQDYVSNLSSIRIMSSLNVMLIVRHGSSFMVDGGNEFDKSSQ